VAVNWGDIVGAGAQALAGASGNQQLYQDIQQRRDQKKQQSQAMMQASLARVSQAQQKINDMLASGTHPETGAPLSDQERQNLMNTQQTLRDFAYQITGQKPPPQSNAPSTTTQTPAMTLGGSPAPAQAPQSRPAQPAQQPGAVTIPPSQYPAGSPAIPAPTGKFDNPADADAYANARHNRGDRPLPDVGDISGGQGYTLPAGSPTTVTGPASGRKNIREQLAERARQAIAQYTANVPANPYAQKYNEIMRAFPTIKPEEAMELALGTAPKTLQDKVAAEMEAEGYTPEQVWEKLRPNTASESWTADGPPVKIGDKWMQPFKSRSGETKLTAMPEGYDGPQAKPVKVYSADNLIKEEFGDHPTAQQILEGRRQWAEAGAQTSTTTGTNTILVQQPDGTTRAYEVQHTSTKTPGTGGGSRPSQGGNGTGGSKSGANHLAPPKAGEVVGGRETPEAAAARKAVDNAQTSYLEVQKAGNHLDPVGSKGIVMAWLHGKVNRVTQTEIESVRNLGGIFERFDGTVSSIEHGTMTRQQYRWFLRSARENYDAAVEVAQKYQSPGPETPATPAPPASPAKPAPPAGNAVPPGWTP
jgi:hypothetical protein